MATKSYWQKMAVDGDRAQEVIRSWFRPLAEGMTAYKAEVLCDAVTDREKKIRAFMTDAEGRHFKFERSARRNYTVSMAPIPSPPPGARP